MPHQRTRTLPLSDLVATHDLAKSIASNNLHGIIIHLKGNLGAGKTTFVQALLAALGYSGIVKSPTYTLVESYVIDGLEVYHFDLYRLLAAEELEFIGIRDYMAADALLVIEWAERGDGVLPGPDLELAFTLAGTERHVVISAHSEEGLKIWQRLGASA